VTTDNEAVVEPAARSSSKLLTVFALAGLGMATLLWGIILPILGIVHLVSLLN